MINQNQQKNDRGRFALVAGIGCGFVIILIGVIVVPLILGPNFLSQIVGRIQGNTPTPTLQLNTPEVIPTYTELPGTAIVPMQSGTALPSLTALYNDIGPGVVSIRVILQQQGSIGEGAGSGFILDQLGHIVTNNHVIADADTISVIFENGIEVAAKLVGADPYSDLAVVQVASLPEDTHPLLLGDSDSVEVGEWVIAIGNPFGLQSSMTAGIVSAVGRTIPTGVTSFSIPQAIQTDAAINPGNSGGPLINLEGEVIGVNAQIETGSTGTNSGVGFAIPINIVRLVAPSLIEKKTYVWPWLGVTGGDLSLLIREANDIQIQQGAYIQSVEPQSPAEDAGLQGSTGTRTIDGLDVPVGGDIVIAVDGEPVHNFSDLLVEIAFKRPGDVVQLTILRDGSEKQISATLAPRP
jgi:S1-C subfamily serine protease